MRALPSVLALLILCGCGGTTGQPQTDYPVFGRGEVPAPFAVGEWTVTLTLARIAFGPAYFCATAAASSDLCPVALSEFIDAAVVDGLEPASQRLGDGQGQTGTIRSTSYDFGIDWFTTQRQPTPALAAPEGHSALFEGLASKGGQSIRFRAAIDAVPAFQDTRVVQGQPLNVELRDGLELTVGLHPGDWWKGVDFDLLAAGISPPGDAAVIAPGSQAHEALLFGMITGRPPTLDWRNIP